MSKGVGPEVTNEYLRGYIYGTYAIQDIAKKSKKGWHWQLTKIQYYLEDGHITTDVWNNGFTDAILDSLN